MDPSSRRKRKREGEPHAAASGTPVTLLCDDVLVDILLRLPSLATLARAALVCTRWRRLASSRGFLRRFRALHRSSPLLGCFLSFADSASTSFHRAQICSDRDLAAAVRGGDFLLAGLEDDIRWRLRDCRDGVLLLASQDQFALFNPISRRHLKLSRPPSCPRSEMFSFHSCLLPSCGGQDARPVSFRVLWLEESYRDLVRAHVYSSDTGEWDSHPWAPASIKPPPPRLESERSFFPSMHAAGRIYWKYEKGKVLLCLDTGSMEFSRVALPPVPDLRRSAAARYVVGETEDGACCLVCVARVAQNHNDYALQVWLRNQEAGSWELEMQVHGALLMIEGAIPLYAVHQVCAVTIGVVLLSSDGGSGRYRYVAFRLKNLIAGQGSFAYNLPRQADFFSCEGLAYPYIMTWPPSSMLQQPRHRPVEDQDGADD